MPRQHLTLRLTAAAARADLVVQGMVQRPRAYVRGLVDHECVHIDGQPCRDAGAPVAAGQVVAVHYDPQQNYREKPKAKLSAHFAVAYEDAQLLVVEKVAGILTVPTERRETHTLVHEVARYLSRGPRLTHRAYIVHRLDRDTSGLLVFGKTQAIADALRDQFAARKPERQYVAIVAGQLAGDRGTERSYLETNDDLDQFSTADPDRGKLAVTHWQVEARMRGATQVRVHLETGRRNQIRVHMAELGHPILGDVRYRPEQARHPAWQWPRLALHAQTLGFSHPLSGQPIRVESPLPECFAQFRRRASPTTR